MAIVLKQPDEYNLSLMLSDFFLSSDSDVIFEIRKGDETVLKEIYSPDAEGMIYVRGRALGRTLEGYLEGNTEAGVKEGISGAFTAYIDNVEQLTFNVLRCRLVHVVPADPFFTGKVFLNFFHKVKWTRPDAVEFLTSFISAGSPVYINVVNRIGNDFVSSDIKIFKQGNINNFETYDTSFASAVSFFPSLTRDSIVAYRLHLKNQVFTYYVDRTPCLHTLQFLYKNGYDVPDTILTRGVVTRKGNTSYETSLVQDVTHKFNVRRSDTFTVSSGKIFSPDDYDRYRDLINSEEVKVWFKDAWRKIIITEEEATEPMRTGSLNAVSFSFSFADEAENNLSLAETFMQWILDPGDKWKDANRWIDTELWNDDMPIP